MVNDYHGLSLDQLELLEKQTLRTIVQALQQASAEAKDVFENTRARSDTEVIVLAEDLARSSLQAAECFPIRYRFRGFIDYKQTRWASTPFGLIPQVLLVDAKASTENNRETLQQSQLPMHAEFRGKNGSVESLDPGVPLDVDIPSEQGNAIIAVTSSFFVHFWYEKLKEKSFADEPPYRRLKAIYILAVPHGTLKDRYNPDPDTTFFGQGKHSPKREEEPRIRIYFSRFKSMCPWRLQELSFNQDAGIAGPSKGVWRDLDEHGNETMTPFEWMR
ncbi:SfiI family type II restriction endonuclease [uncultured Thiodictyon sp.]|uniref:SfiI family type II restriction endonuclease n=1 Tax=uncultured Thiodictyon sp. TaxID=1846217 RepID=UPI0025E516DC|nr:SfiI family type II restriction endonuclease [uncultured Thiodictyon sp.]